MPSLTHAGYVRYFAVLELHIPSTDSAPVRLILKALHGCKLGARERREHLCSGHSESPLLETGTPLFRAAIAAVCPCGLASRQ